MLRTRVMPCLLLQDEGLVKTVRFKNETYIGDPINSIRIYNEMGVDELVFLDIRASVLKQEPPFQKIAEIASECFMPFVYGGGIKTLDHARRLFDSGVEKIVLNSVAFENPGFVGELAALYGAQAIVVAIDVKKSFFKADHVYIYSGARNTGRNPVEYAKTVKNMGAGEILLNSISRDGMMQGFDLDLIRGVSDCVDIPVIALGGAGDVADIGEAKKAGASGIGLGSMAVYQNRNRGILINFPSQRQLLKVLDQV